MDLITFQQDFHFWFTRLHSLKTTQLQKGQTSEPEFTSYAGSEHLGVEFYNYYWNFQALEFHP